MGPGLIRVAVILGAHGIRGDVKVRSFTEDPRAFSTYGPLQSDKARTFEVLRVRPQGADFIAAFKGVTDRNQAEALKGIELFVSREKLPEPEDDEVYAHDLIGLTVQQKDGDVLGKVVAVPNYGAGDLLEIAMPGARDTLLVPFAPVYVTERRPDLIVVDLPEGYLDED
jgi:16S rRNA processing protein RimM